MQEQREEKNISYHERETQILTRSYVRGFLRFARVGIILIEV